MSQAIEDRRSIQNLPAAERRQEMAPSREHPLEREVRLRIKEADAHWQRIKEIILIGSAVFVILSACIASIYLLLSKGSSPSDRLVAFYVLGQMMGILVGVVMGKNIKWRK
jgi:hypothetical protein